MKQKLLIIMMLFASSYGFSQITISAARALGAGAIVTVKGIVTNGSELGDIRYFQDTTAGIAAYGSSIIGLKRGDSILITGTIKIYSELMEIDPVTSFTILDSNVIMPSPKLIIPDSLNEYNEGRLVRINNATFTSNPGGTFSSNSSYGFTSGGQSSVIYIRTGHPLIGSIIPSSPVDLIGISTQHSYSGPTTGFQLLCRDSADIIMNNNIAVTSKITESGISQTDITFSWTTNIAGTSEIMYGNTPSLGSTVSASGTTINHSVSLTALTASELLYVKAFSVDGTDTAFSPIKTFITQSASTGNVIAYFNTPTDHSVSSGTNAITLPNAIDDTLIAYINRATSSVDYTMYNFNETGLSSVSAALNAAHNRGVIVRVIFDGAANNSGIQNLLPAIKKVGSPTGATYGIMHNKFIIIDAYDSDANVPLVWTGGTNITEGQINTDPNTVIIVQDKSLAIAYTLEFNEMFGSSTATPDMNNIKFGPDKMDNTPHNFIIGGKDVECFFSPSDGTNDKIIQTINEADNNISIATMLITRSDIGYALQDAVNNNSIDMKILVNSEGQCSQTVWTLLSALLGEDLQEDANVTGIMHHKFMVADEGTSNSPTLLVGCHNWSNSANNKNDENTLIFHDNQELANIYYQAFKYRFDENKYMSIAENGFANSVSCYPNPSNGQFVVEMDIEKATDLTINIFDISGRNVLSQTQTANAGSNNISINASDLANGTYVLQMVNSEGKRFVNTLIIQ